MSQRYLIVRTIKTLNRHWLPLTLLLGSICLLQLHSISFWSEWVGEKTGVLWSILLELGSLWFWYNRGWKNKLVASMTTTVLLFGPLFQISRPIISEQMKRTSEQKKIKGQIQALRNEIGILQISLKAYQRNSSDRLGWLGKISETEGKVEERQNLLRSLLSETNAFEKQGGMDVQTYVIFILQVLSILLFQCFNVLSIRHISRCFQLETLGKDKEKDGAGKEKYRKDNIEIENEDWIRKLQVQVKQELAFLQISQAEFCRRNGLHPRDLSLFLNYLDAQKTSRRKLPKHFFYEIQRCSLRGGLLCNSLSP